MYGLSSAEPPGRPALPLPSCHWYRGVSEGCLSGQFPSLLLENASKSGQGRDLLQILHRICPPTAWHPPEEGKVNWVSRTRSPKPDYFRADSNLSVDFLNKYLVSTYCVLGTLLGADFKVSSLWKREAVNFLRSFLSEFEACWLISIKATRGLCPFPVCVNVKHGVARSSLTLGIQQHYYGLLRISTISFPAGGKWLSVLAPALGRSGACPEQMVTPSELLTAQWSLSY